MSYQHSKFTGYYSSLEIVEEDNQKYVKKMITIPLDLQTAQDIEQRVILQRNALTDMGVPIPELVNIEIHQVEGGHNIFIKEKFEGSDFMDIVDDENFDFYIDKLLRDIYEPLLKSTNEQYLRAGIDTTVRNYVYKQHDSKFCYVDFIPPKVYYKGHYSQEIPEIEGPFYDIRMVGHYDRAGVFYVLYVNFIRLFPTRRKLIQGKFEQFLDSINEAELKKYMTESPFYRIENPASAIEVVKKLDDWKGINYYYLREAICIAAELNPDFREKQSDMFKLTHHETDPDSPEYGMLPQARFEKVKGEVVEAFSLL